MGTDPKAPKEEFIDPLLSGRGMWNQVAPQRDLSARKNKMLN